MRLFLLSLTFFLIASSSAQNIDSLKQVLSQPDITSELRGELLLDLSKAEMYEHSDSAVTYAQEAILLYSKIDSTIKVSKAQVLLASIYLEISEFDNGKMQAYNALIGFTQLKDLEGIGNCHNVIGLCFDYQDIRDSAMVHYLIAKETSAAAKDSSTLSVVFNNIGMLSYTEGQLDTAIAYFKRAKFIQIENENYETAANTTNNLGGMHKIKGQLDIALENYFESLKIHDSLGLKKGAATCHLNIGRLYENLGFDDLAMEHYNISENLRKEISDLYGLGTIFHVKGMMYEKMGLDSMANAYFEQSIEIKLEIGDRSGLLNSYLSEAYSFIRNGDSLNALMAFEKASSITEVPSKASRLNLLLYKLEFMRESFEGDNLLLSAKTAYKESVELQSPKFIAKASKLLSNVFEENGKGEEALFYYKEFKVMDDSLKAVEVSKATSRQQAKLGYQKETLILEQQAKEEAQRTQEILSRKNNLEYSGITMAVFILFGLVFLLGKYQLPPWAIELSVFLPFLILFEFLLVFTDPFVETFTEGDPLIKLLINALIGGIIFPLHAFFERMMKRRLFTS